jgi:hypothetical protein
MGVWSVDFIPRGARFGPLLGEIQRPEQVTVTPIEAASASGCLDPRGVASTDPEANAVDQGHNNDTAQRPPKRWKVFSDSGAQVIRIIDTQNPQRSNWMSQAKLAKTLEAQNLVACQVEFNFPQTIICKINDVFLDQKRNYFN